MLLGLNPILKSHLQHVYANIFRFLRVQNMKHFWFQALQTRVTLYTRVQWFQPAYIFSHFHDDVVERETVALSCLFWLNNHLFTRCRIVTGTCALSKGHLFLALGPRAVTHLPQLVPLSVPVITQRLSTEMLKAPRSRPGPPTHSPTLVIPVTSEIPDCWTFQSFLFLFFPCATLSGVGMFPS